MKRTVTDLTLVRLGVCAAIGVGVGLAAAAGPTPRWAPLLGWVATALVFCCWTWMRIRPISAGDLPTHALREDTGRAVGDVALLTASGAGVLGVGALLAAGSTGTGGNAGDALLGVCAVVASWFVVHMFYTLHYARLHVASPDGGIDFPGKDGPTYRDFAYVAYTIGMTYQVSDTGFQSTVLRTTALRHALLSYFLGAGVIATTINLVVQLVGSGG